VKLSGITFYDNHFIRSVHAIFFRHRRAEATVLIDASHICERACNYCKWD